MITWSEAHKYYNQCVIVEGTIVRTYDSGIVCFLNFSKNYDYFTAVIFASDFPEYAKHDHPYNIARAFLHVSFGIFDIMIGTKCQCSLGYHILFETLESGGVTLNQQNNLDFITN